MTPDRELLELAAKAAGYKIDHPWNALRLTFDPPIVALCIPDVSTGWDPLDNSGHAMRLAVRLQIGLHHFRDSCAAASGGRFFTELHNGNPQAAACRAIVRAAAEIGKTKS